MQNVNPEDGLAAIITSVAMTVLSLSAVQELVSIVAGCVAIVSGCFAIRYYWLKTNEIKTRKKY